MFYFANAYYVSTAASALIRSAYAKIFPTTKYCLITLIHIALRRYSVVSIVSRPRIGRSGVRFAAVYERRCSSLKHADPIRSPRNFLIGISSGRQSGRRVKLTTHLHLVPRLKTKESKPQHTASSWRG
jgi:hypothetical protein